MLKRCALMLTLALLPAAVGADAPPVAPNGIGLYRDYRTWQVIAPSYREDKNHIRVILGNPFPDGAVLAKVAWTTRKHPSFPVATEPAEFVQVEFMVKNAAAYPQTGGWGFARFVGNDYTPYGKDAGFVKECFGCHTPVKGNDYVFTGFAPTP
jgi:hypothetical protein